MTKNQNHLNNTNTGYVSSRSQITGIVEVKGTITGKVNEQKTLSGETHIPQIIDEIPYLREDLEAVLDVGGITDGTIYLSGTTIEQVLRDLLYPLLYPTLSSPTAFLMGTGSKLMEYGTSQYVTFTAVLDRGRISPAYKTSGYRSGEAVGFTLNGSAEQTTGEWNNVLVNNNNREFTAVIEYSKGEQPRDSWGNKYEEPLPHGFVQSNTFTYEFVYAFWANVTNIENVVKLPLVSENEENIILDFPPQTVNNPETFDIPNTLTIKKIEVLNELSGKYEDCSKEFTRMNITHPDAGGNIVNYYRYIDNRGYKADRRTIRISW